MDNILSPSLLALKMIITLFLIEGLIDKLPIHFQIRIVFFLGKHFVTYTHLSM